MTLNEKLSQSRGCFRFIGWALLLAGIGFLCAAVSQTRLPISGKITKGVVTKIDERISIGSVSQQKGESDAWYFERRSRSKGVSYDLTVHYTPEGAAPADFKSVATFGLAHKVGDQVDVIYLPSNPLGAEIYTARQVWLPLCVGFTVSFLCIGGGFYLLRAIRRAAIQAR